MNKSAFVRARVEPHLKAIAEDVLNEIGITPTQAITMLYKQIANQHQWPIELKVPNKETKQVLDETDQGIGLVTCKNLDDLFKDLGI